ncbi:diphthine synthase [Archaeoglobus sulfaticallidus PM70-1]|uniref:Diphthine synthase n=1 Tax=Archaeoglobus sulfaticallidus PM70-1 TaxID=387631 RepID=N0BEI9_9EURY|nr:diphthine synthase [Archaeoglobus sulfaticallidus]AGK60687.1 diphthine synthase [Archaeoglobus sulfaticallidus PM70-1]
MLIFIGTGLWDAEDISLKGLRYARSSDEVYLELYTSKPNIDTDSLSELIGKEVGLLSRSDLEENSRYLVEKAKERDIVILVPGDPMVATTHTALRVEAKKRGVKTVIIHSSSILSAVCGITGLHIYKFGKSATISYPYREKVSKTPVDVIESNRKINAHTLLFLDLHPEPMKIDKAISLLEQVGNVSEYYGVGIARAGSENMVVKCDKLKNLKEFDFGDPMHILITLSPRIHFMEFEYLREFADAPDTLEKLVE